MTNFFLKTLKRFKSDERGVTLVEYGIAITLAIVLGGTALSLLAGDIGGAMGEAGTEMEGTRITY